MENEGRVFPGKSWAHGGCCWGAGGGGGAPASGRGCGRRLRPRRPPRGRWGASLRGEQSAGREGPPRPTGSCVRGRGTGPDGAARRPVNGPRWPKRSCRTWKEECPVKGCRGRFLGQEWTARLRGLSRSEVLAGVAGAAGPPHPANACSTREAVTLPSPFWAKPSGGTEGVGLGGRGAPGRNSSGSTTSGKSLVGR